MLNIKYVLQAVVAFAVLLLMSCEHKELCYDCSRTIKIQVIFDWRNTPNVTPETMRLYLFPLDGGNLRRMNSRIIGAGISTFLLVVTGPYVSTLTRNLYFTVI